MAIFLGSLNRSALRAAAQPPADDLVVDETFTDQDWATPPDGYTTVFYDDFSSPVTGNIGGYESWQGIDRSKWRIPSVDGEPDPSSRNPEKDPFYGSNAMIKSGGGFYTYGGRRPTLAPGDNTIDDDERAKVSVSSRPLIFKPGFSGPRIIRIRTEWEQARAYHYMPWSFSSWAEVTVGGVTFQHGWEHDLENRGSDYDANARTFRPHFNNHIWQRRKDTWQSMGSQQNPLKKDVQLPSNPRDPITIDIRWRRGSDFWDPYQTYVEWWVEEVVGGVATGNMVRQYHWSPRHFLESVRNWPTPSDAPPADPLPPELANVAPSNVWAPKNSLQDQSPYDTLGNWLYQPYAAAHDPSYTWWDVVKDSWSDEGAGGLIWSNGFQRENFFLSDDGTLFVSDYDDHHSHVDDEHCFSSVCWGVVVFDPD